MKRSSRLIICISVLLAAFPSLFASNSRRNPNIVLLFADDVGYGDLSSFGHPTIQTPNLDRLASEGIRLTSFYSAPVCVPARVQLMTGRYPLRVKLRGTGPGGNGGLSQGEVTLAQALKAVGYRTAMMGKWHLGHAREEFLPVRKGFDYWFGLPYSNDMQKPWVNTDEPLWLYENTQKIEHPVDLDRLTTRYTEHALQFLQEARGDRFFLYLAYSMAHLPIHTTEEFRGKSRAGLYGDVIQTIDWSVGRIVQTLAELGLERDTLVIWTSDNGPWNNLPSRMLQAGNLPWHTGSPGALRGSKGTTYEGGVRVPCIIRWTGELPAGRTTAEMAATMDLYVTVVKAAGGTLPEHVLDGHDLMPLLKGETTTSPRREFFYCRGDRIEALRSGPWKFRNVEEDELFNLEIDPSERYNRAEEEPELVLNLKRRLQEMAQSMAMK